MTSSLRGLSPDATYELWIKPTALSANSSQTILEVDNKRVTLEIQGSKVLARWIDGVGGGQTLEAYGVNNDAWIHIGWQTSLNTKVTRTWAGRYISEIQNHAFGDYIFPTFANFRIGNNERGDSSFIGWMRELKIWNEFRSDLNLKRFVNLEVGTEYRANLAHYFKFAFDTEVLRIRDSQNSSGLFDFTRINLKPNESPVRFR